MVDAADPEDQTLAQHDNEYAFLLIETDHMSVEDVVNRTRRAFPELFAPTPGEPASPKREAVGVRSVKRMTPGIPEDLLYSYAEFPRVEERFGLALDLSLAPRGPSMLFDLVESLGLPAGAAAVDVGCGEGSHALTLAQRFGLTVTGVDPVPRHIEIANAQLAACAWAAVRSRVRFILGSAQSLPIVAASMDLVWCRDVLVHVADLDQAFDGFRRVLRPGGIAVVYQMLGTELLEPGEREWLFSTMGVVPASADHTVVEAAIGKSGLRVFERIDLATE